MMDRNASWLRPLARLEWPVVLWVLFAKATVFLFGLFAVPALSGKWPGWWTLWNRWDALRYLQIARDGYVATGEERFNLVGLPLYPWLVRAVSWLGCDLSVGAFLVSGVASIAAGLLLAELVRADEGEVTGRYAVWFLFIFPTSYFLHIAYTEATLLAFAIGCFVAARRQCWWLAGLLGGLASLTRWQGLILLPAIALEAWPQFRLTRRLDPRCFWLALIPCGFGIYLLLNYQLTGDACAFQKLMAEHFSRELAPPWIGLRSLWDSFFEESVEYVMISGLAEAFFTFLAVGCMIWSWFALRLSYSVWITGNVLLCLSSTVIQAVPRYALIMFPIYILCARAARGRPLCFTMISMPSLLLLALFLSKFVLGHWAF